MANKDGYTVRADIKVKWPEMRHSGDYVDASDVQLWHQVFNEFNRELNAINIIKSNPDMHNNKQYRLAGGNAIPEGDAACKSNGDIYAKDINDLVDALAKVGQTCDKVSVGEIPVGTKIEKIIGALWNIDGKLDGSSSLWNGMWCALSCQVSCQQSCMLACQSCHGGTCHDQNCGGWS